MNKPPLGCKSSSASIAADQHADADVLVTTSELVASLMPCSFFFFCSVIFGYSDILL